MTVDTPQTLGALLQSRRAELKMTLRTLQQTSGVPLSSLHRLLRDEVGTPKPQYISALARALTMPQAPLFAAAGYPVGPDAETWRPASTPGGDGGSPAADGSEVTK